MKFCENGKYENFSDGVNLHPLGVACMVSQKQKKTVKNIKNTVFSAPLRLCVKKEPAKYLGLCNLHISIALSYTGYCIRCAQNAIIIAIRRTYGAKSAKNH